MNRLSLLLTLALVMAGGCRRGVDPAPAAAVTPVPVRVMTVTATVAPQTQPVPGTIRPFARATNSPWAGP